MRAKTYKAFFGNIANRLEPKKSSRLIVLNTTWHPEDYVNRLAEHWPTLRMSITGDVWVSNADPDWSPKGLVQLRDPDGTPRMDGIKEVCRLAAHWPDPEKKTPLWPERYPADEIERQREKYLHSPGDFERFFMSNEHDDSSALCKDEFIARCKKLAQKEGIHGLVPRYEGDWWTFTGVDLAVTPDKKGGETVFFTFAVRPEDSVYIILDIDMGHWDALTIINKLLLKIQLFRSYAAVENNATQEFLIQIARSMGNDLPIRSHNTTAQGKAHAWQGVIGIFHEMAMGRWRIPTTKEGDTAPPVRQFITACRAYTPERHTADVLMASYIARSLAMKLGAMSSGPPAGMGVPGRRELSPTQRAMMR
jgi:hypothetical protein